MHGVQAQQFQQLPVTQPVQGHGAPLPQALQDMQAAMLKTIHPLYLFPLLVMSYGIHDVINGFRRGNFSLILTGSAYTILGIVGIEMAYRSGQNVSMLISQVNSLTEEMRSQRSTAEAYCAQETLKLTDELHSLNQQLKSLRQSAQECVANLPPPDANQPPQPN